MKKIKNFLGNIYVCIFICLIITSVLILIILNKRALPVIMSYASEQTKRIGIEVLRQAGYKQVAEKIKADELFEITKNNNGEIESIDFNTAALNETIVLVAKYARKRLKEVEMGENLPEEMYRGIDKKKLKKGIVYEVPLGVAFNNVFFSNFGPKIPVKIEYSGNVGIDVKTRVSEYGINSALIEVFIYLEVTQSTVLPFQSKETKVTSEIPIIMKVVKGSVPNYLSGINGTYSLPMD